MSETVVQSASITSGFFNSRNGDRTYDAEQMSSLFAGVFPDGVFLDYPASDDRFTIAKGSGLHITIGPGRAWFNHIWVDNSSTVTVLLDAPSASPRLDGIFIKIDKSNENPTPRSGNIVVIKGTPAANPVDPSPENTENVFYYKLGDARINPGASSVASVANNQSIPLITTPFQVINLQPYIDQWNAAVDAAVQAQLATYLGDDGSPLYEVIKGQPSIWLYEEPITDNAHTLILEEGRVHPWPQGENATSYYPKELDIVIGSNGCYAEIITVPQSGSNYGVFPLRRSIVPEVPNNSPIRIDFCGGSRDVSDYCSHTFTQIKAYYDAGRELWFRWTPVDAAVSGFSWDSAKVYCGATVYYHPYVANDGIGEHFEFIYNDIKPSASSISGFHWTTVICEIYAEQNRTICTYSHN